jgi:hypothetical protein
MPRIATLAAAALVVASAAASDAEARSRNRGGAAVAAGIVGLAAGAIIAGSATRSYAAPAYSYGYPAYGQGYYGGYAPVHSYGYYDEAYYAQPSYRVAPVMPYYAPRPVRHSRRVLRTYDDYSYGGSLAPGDGRAVIYSYQPSYGGW